MLRLVTDENFDNDILRGLRRRRSVDVVRVQDVGLRQADDPTILAWSAEEGRVVLTHEAATMTRYAYDRVRAGLPMPGVVEVPDDLPTGRAVEEILLLAEATFEGELEGRVLYLPL